MIYVVTGKLGSGKSLVAVGKIRDYLNQGRMVATNLDLYLEHLINPFSKNAVVYRVPDKPSADDLNALPTPYEGDYSEEKTGLLVLDELGTWFNSRTWNDKSRGAVIDWFLHARKLGWDIIFIVQNVSMIDAQAREGLAEMVVHCKRLDRFSLPFISWFFKLAGLEVKPPKIHLGIVKYGASESSALIERWVYTGRDLYNAYDTKQVFSHSNNGFAQMLPPNTIYGRLTNEKQHTRRRFINAINKLGSTFKSRAAFSLGLLLAFVLTFTYSNLFPDAVAETQLQAKTQIKEGQQTEIINPLDGVFITASVKSRKGFDYVFESDRGAFYPDNLGYKVLYISECRAALLLNDQKTYISCSPYSTPRAQQPEPREGVLAESLAL